MGDTYPDNQGSAWQADMYPTTHPVTAPEDDRPVGEVPPEVYGKPFHGWACTCFQMAPQYARLPDPDRPCPIHTPEDDRPVGEVPPEGAGRLMRHLARAAESVGEVPPRFVYRDPTKPDPYQALLTQLHEARTDQADAWDEGYKSGRSDGVETEQRMQMRDWWAPMPETPNPYRALLDGEVRP